MPAPKVSIVMPIYNVEQYLEKCLESVTNQTLRDIEIICVNDGSTDSSSKIIDKYAKNDNRIVVVNKKNTGYGNSMNVGIDKATGEYIGVVETDDYVEKDMFETLYNIAKSNDVDFVKSDHYKFAVDKEGKEVKQYFDIDPTKTHYGRVINPQETLSVFDLIMMTWSGIYKTEFLRKNNIRHNETPGASFQDNGFWFQVFTKGKSCYFVNKAFYHLRRDNPNSSVKQKNKVYAMCTEYDFIEQYLKNNGLFKKYSDIYFVQRCKSYHFTLKRISHEFVLEFLIRFSEDFSEPIKNGYLKGELLSEHIWKYTREIVNDPIDYYCRKYYNPLIPNEHVELEAQYLKIKNKQLQTELDTIQHSKEYILGKKIRLLQRFYHRYNSKKNGGDEHPFKSAAGEILNIRQNATPSIAFVASDNNRSSGAFISMSVLARILENEHHCKVTIYTPKKGSGTNLLRKYDLEEKQIDSYDWVVPLHTTYNHRTKCRLLFETVFTLFQSIKMAKSLCASNIDIVHINTSYAYIGYFAARIAKIPVIWHLREMLEEDQGRTIFVKEKAYGIMSNADNVIAISKTVYSKYHPYFNNKIRLIYNGIDEQTFIGKKPDILTQNSVKMIFVGGLSERKGCFFLIDALEQFQNKYNIKFTITFIGNPNKRFIDRIKTSTLGEKIRYLGFQENVSKHYREADIAFTCSDHEAFGRITVEAMMSGCLVVGVNSGCTKELIENEVDGYLYEKNDIESFCSTLYRAISNREKSSTIAICGQNKARCEYNSEKNAKEIKDLYDLNLVHKKSGAKKLFRNLIVTFLNYLTIIPQKIMVAVKKITYSDSSEVLKQAKTMLAKGNYVTAFDLVSQSIQLPEAQFIIAKMYKDGLGIKKNVRKSKYWFKKAAINGSNDALLTLFDLDSKCDYRTIRKMMHTYKERAAKGDVSSQIALCELYRKKPLEDRNEAIKYAKMASNAGNDKATIMLIDILSKGNEAENNEAYALCQTLADKGHAGAQYRMYVMLSKREDPQNAKLALHYLSLSADNGYPKSKEALEKLKKRNNHE